MKGICNIGAFWLFSGGREGYGVFKQYVFTFLWALYCFQDDYHLTILIFSTAFYEVSSHHHYRRGFRDFSFEYIDL